MLLLYLHLIPLLVCSSVNDALGLTILSLATQVLTELPWLFAPEKGDITSYVSIGILAVLGIVLSHTALHQSWFSQHNLVILGILVIWGIAANHTQGSSSAKLKRAFFPDKNKPAETEKLNEIVSKTKNLEITISKLEESQKQYMEMIVARRNGDDAAVPVKGSPRAETPQARSPQAIASPKSNTSISQQNGKDKVYVNPFPFNLKPLKLSPQSSPRVVPSQSFESQMEAHLKAQHELILAQIQAQLEAQTQAQMQAQMQVQAQAQAQHMSQAHAHVTQPQAHGHGLARKYLNGNANGQYSTKPQSQLQNGGGLAQLSEPFSAKKNSESVTPSTKGRYPWLPTISENEEGVSRHAEQMTSMFEYDDSVESTTTLFSPASQMLYTKADSISNIKHRKLNNSNISKGGLNNSSDFESFFELSPSSEAPLSPDGHFSLHGLPFTSAITNLLTRQLFQEDNIPSSNFTAKKSANDDTNSAEGRAPKSVDGGATGPNVEVFEFGAKDEGIYVSELKLHKRREIEHQFKRELSINLERLISSPSLSEMKNIIKSIHKILISKFDACFSPYLTAEMISTWHLLLRYYVVQNVFPHIKIYHVLVTLPIFLVVSLVKLPWRIVRFHIDLCVFIPLLVLRKVVLVLENMVL